MYGTIKVIFGCMFSGKTSEIIKLYRKCKIINKKVLSINFAQDNRYSNDDSIVSHNLDKIDCIKVNKLCDVPESTILEHDYIMIDEGQFFSDLKEFVLKWCEVFKKNIVVIGLDGDYKRNSFGQIFDLIPIADEVHKLKALCKLCNDGTDALFTHRISTEHEQVVIGNSNYIPVCRRHYVEQNQALNQKEFQ
jgi:thymidine kinase